MYSATNIKSLQIESYFAGRHINLSAALIDKMKDFSTYDAIIDARTPREFAEDHIPGAINLPVVDNDEYAHTGTMHRSDTHTAYIYGVAASLNRLSHYTATVLPTFPRGSRILVYCFRGGKRSKLWYDTLTSVGSFKAEKLEGGWKAYRAWVIEQLGDLPKRLRFVVLCGSTGVGKTRLLSRLAQRGAQVLDLEAMASHRGSVIGYLPSTPQPTQKWFDSMLRQKLQGFDATQPIFVESESRKIGRIQLPESLFLQIRQSPCIGIEASMPERVRVWMEDYGHFRSDPDGFVARLDRLRRIAGHAEVNAWIDLVRDGQFAECFERLMVNHYDPLYLRSMRHWQERMLASVTLQSTDDVGLDDACERLLNISTRIAQEPGVSPSP